MGVGEFDSLILAAFHLYQLGEIRHLPDYSLQQSYFQNLRHIYACVMVIVHTCQCDRVSQSLF